MCVPCAAPVLFEFWWVLLLPLALVGYVLNRLFDFLPHLGMGVLWVLALVWRFFSGAILVKPFNQLDEETDVEPRFSRPVRGVARTALALSVAGLLIDPVMASLILGTATVGVAGAAAYGRREAIRSLVARRPIEGPVRVKSQIGSTQS